jgi:predicted transcriptional regulator
MSYGNKIIINSYIKRDIAVRLGKTFNTVNQYITKLSESKILIREGRGVYYLNPLFYGKGKWKDILELREKLEVKISYEDGIYKITHK